MNQMNSHSDFSNDDNITEILSSICDYGDDDDYYCY